jgi:hypothetical protein
MTREKAIELATKAYAATLPTHWHVMPDGMKPIIATLEALGLLKFDEPPPVRPLFDPQADAAVSAVIEKTLYEKDWPDTAVAGFIIDDLRKAGFEIVRIFRNTP